MIVVVTGTGTDVGKTYVTTQLKECLPHATVIKPLETGSQRDSATLNAFVHKAFYHRTHPLSPYANTLMGEAPPDLVGIQQAIVELHKDNDLIVEGAGGYFVPLTQDTYIGPWLHEILKQESEVHWLLVAPDRLGVLSDVHAYVRALTASGFELDAILLNDMGEGHPLNATILKEQVGVPVLKNRLELELYVKTLKAKSRSKYDNTNECS